MKPQPPPPPTSLITRASWPLTTNVAPAEDKTTEPPVVAGGDSSPTRPIQNAPDDLKEQMETLSMCAWSKRIRTRDGTRNRTVRQWEDG